MILVASLVNVLHKFNCANVLAVESDSVMTSETL